MSSTELPADEAALAALIRDAEAPLAIEGRGSKRGMLRPVQAARSVSTRALTGITHYSPTELVISARAGTPLAEVEAALAAKGQMIIAEPPDLAPILGGDGAAEGGPSIGGLVATNLSGPRRIARGAMRDHLLGVRFVNGAGQMLRSGGRVLKNVTGLDLCKLLAGSHGTLGVMTEVTLKVLPAPEATATLVLPGLDAARGVAALCAAMGTPFDVTGTAFLPIGAARTLGFPASVTLIRIEEFADFVPYRADRLRALLAEFGAADVLDTADSVRLWRAVRDAVPLSPGTDEAVWRVSVPPTGGADVLAALEAAGMHGFLDWSGGLVWLAGPAEGGVHAAVAAAAQAAGGTWTLMRAPAPLRVAVAVVPGEAPALAALSRRVKQAMDPRGILNPGRMVAGL